MLLKNALRFLLFPAFFSTILIAGLSLLIRILLDCFSIEISEGVLLGWIPFVIGIICYFVLLHHRLGFFFKEIHKGVVGLMVFAVGLLILPTLPIQLAYIDTQFELKNAKTLDSVNPSQKKTVWNLKGDFPDYKMSYLSDYQEYTSGKHPDVEYLSFALIHFEEEDIWLLCTENESIEQSASDTEKTRLYYKIKEACAKQIEQLNDNTSRYLIPLSEGNEMHYARKTLDDLDYKGRFPQRIYTLSTDFEIGITSGHNWFLLISLALNLVFFFLFSLFGRKSVANLNTGLLNISFLLVIKAYIFEAPLTCLILLITLDFVIIEIIHEPNILSLKSDPYLLRWSVNNEVLKTGEWYRLLTYPFTNFQLYNKLLDPLLFAFCASEIEKRIGHWRLLFLLIFAQVAGGFAAVYFGPAINCGLTVFTIAITSFYCFSGFQRQVGFSNWKLIGITLLIFGLFLGSITEFLEYPKLIAAALVGLAFGPFLKLRETE